MPGTVPQTTAFDHTAITQTVGVETGSDPARCGQSANLHRQFQRRHPANHPQHRKGGRRKGIGEQSQRARIRRTPIGKADPAVDLGLEATLTGGLFWIQPRIQPIQNRQIHTLGITRALQTVIRSEPLGHGHGHFIFDPGAGIEITEPCHDLDACLTLLH